MAYTHLSLFSTAPHHPLVSLHWLLLSVLADDFHVAKFSGELFVPILLCVCVWGGGGHRVLLKYLLLPSIFPSKRVFSSESALHIRWPKYWSYSFSFSISPSNEYSGLIPYRIDWCDPGTNWFVVGHNANMQICVYMGRGVYQCVYMYRGLGCRGERREILL